MKYLLFTYEQDDEPINLNKTPEEQFKIEYFYQIVDTAIQSMELRFQQFEEYSNMFGFLYFPEKLRSISENDSMKCCFDLDISLRNGEKHDIDGAELFFELKILRQMIPEEFNKSIEVLQLLVYDHSIYMHCLLAAATEAVADRVTACSV
ncbi:hypothetical protein QTP88_014665 [Uroleucon formosanum]